MHLNGVGAFHVTAIIGLEHALRDMGHEVVCEAARRENALGKVLRIVGHSLHLGRIELAHRVVVVGAQVLAVGEEAGRHDFVVPELIHSRLAAEGVEGVVGWLVLRHQEFGIGLGG